MKNKTKFNKNTEKFTWVWLDANKTVYIEYNPILINQANLIKTIWTAGSFDNFKHWANARQMNVTVCNGISHD